MSKITKIIAALAAVLTMALAGSALTAPKAQAYWYGGMYRPYYGAAYYPFGGAFYNPVSQWIVLSSLFNPYYGGLFY